MGHMVRFFRSPQFNMTNKDSLHSQISDASKSQYQKYQELVVGEPGLWALLRFELVMFFCSSMPGALGFFLRKLFYPSILKDVGRGVVFGRNIAIRHGKKISIGDGVVLDDNVLLDAKGEQNKGIIIGENSMISRNSALACKDGNIEIGSNVAIGINSLIHAVAGSDVQLGDDVIAGAFSYLVGGGTYSTDELDVPFKKQGAISKGGVKIANNVWLGSQVQVLDGVSIGKGSIIGAGSIVTRPVADYDVVAGVPAKKIRSRQD